MATAAEAPQTQDRQTRKPWSHSRQTRPATGLSPNLIWNSCSSYPILEGPAKAEPHGPGINRPTEPRFGINNSNPCNLRSMGALQPHLMCNQKRTKTKPSAPFHPGGAAKRHGAWAEGRGASLGSEEQERKREREREWEWEWEKENQHHCVQPAYLHHTQVRNQKKAWTTLAFERVQGAWTQRITFRGQAGGSLAHPIEGL